MMSHHCTEGVWKVEKTLLLDGGTVEEASPPHVPFCLFQWKVLRQESRYPRKTKGRSISGTVIDLKKIRSKLQWEYRLPSLSV